jgi:hypothetical protein
MLEECAVLIGLSRQRCQALEAKAFHKLWKGLQADPVLRRLWEQHTGEKLEPLQDEDETTIEGTDANHDSNAQPTQHTRSRKAVRRSRLAGGADPAGVQRPDHAGVATPAARASRPASRSRS